METERQCYSVAQFCDAHEVKHTAFYALLKAGKGPRIMKIGRRTLISTEAAREWREARERETAQPHAAAA